MSTQTLYNSGMFLGPSGTDTQQQDQTDPRQIDWGAILGGGGNAVAGIANAMAGNRGSQFSGQALLAQLLQNSTNSANAANSQYLNDYENQQKTNQATQQDAWRKLLSTEHTLNPSPMPNITPYAAKTPAQTGQMTQGAQALRDQVMSRLVNGSGLPTPVQPQTYNPLSTVNSNLLKPSTGESILGWLGPALGGLGHIFGL